MTYTITADTGGTFTDIVVASDGEVVGLFKAPTTPSDMFTGILAALELAAKQLKRTVQDVLAETETIIYATTRSTNAILERKTATTAFLVTQGHPDVLVYREGGKHQPFNLALVHPEPYVPRSLTFEIPERVWSDGRVIEPLDEDGVVRVLERLNELHVEAVGVCLLWSIVNPQHELRVGELIEEHLPGIDCTLSHELNPILREYRRASATVIDASLKPLMKQHLDEIDSRLRSLGFQGQPLMVTHISGGMLPLPAMTRQPLHTVDSGPALAPVAGQRYGKAEDDAGNNLIVVDSGGTSFDVSLIRAGRIAYTREKWLGAQWTGHMTGMPAVDTQSIGTGGGSIASVDSEGLLRVGPESAGAVPGPACYGRGGSEPTVTDAAVALGYIDPDYFLAGRMKLERERAAHALRESVAGPLGLSVDQAAEAIMVVWTEKMRSFILEMTVAQGLDPRECLIITGGGSAGLGIVRIARELGVPRILVPTMAAGLSAVGGQYSDIMANFTRSGFTTSRSFAFDFINGRLQEIEEDMTIFVNANVTDDAQERRELYCAMRYENQVWELEVPLGQRDRFNGENDVVDLQRRLDEMHSAVFGVSQPGEAVECLTWRGEARIVGGKPELPSRQPSGERVMRTRSVSFEGQRLDAEIRRGDELRPDDTVEGPAIIEEGTTTIVLVEGSRALVRPTHYLIDMLPAGPQLAGQAIETTTEL